MKIIQGKRQTGKTTTLIHLSAALDIPIAVGNYCKISRIEELSKKLRVNIRNPIMFTDDNLRGLRKVLIDDVDDLSLDTVVYFYMNVGRYMSIPFVTCTNKNKTVKVLEVLKGV